MQVKPCALPEVLVIEPRLSRDERGFFYESFNQAAFARATGISTRFVQDNHSYSLKNVLRGLHYQIQRPQGKLIQIVSGEVFDVAVDLRRSSQTFGKWVGYTLRAEHRHCVWIPAGFAHGFLVVSDGAEVVYKVTDYWAPEYERKIIWNDPDLNIRWPLQDAPMLSAADRSAQRFRDAELFA